MADHVPRRSLVWFPVPVIDGRLHSLAKRDGFGKMLFRFMQALVDQAPNCRARRFSFLRLTDDLPDVFHSKPQLPCALDKTQTVFLLLTILLIAVGFVFDRMYIADAGVITHRIAGNT